MREIRHLIGRLDDARACERVGTGAGTDVGFKLAAQRRHAPRGDLCGGHAAIAAAGEYRIEGIGCVSGTPEAIRHDDHRILEPDDSVDAAPPFDGTRIDAEQLAAEHRRDADGRVEHVRLAHIYAVARRPIHLVRNVETRNRLADERVFAPRLQARMR